MKNPFFVPHLETVYQAAAFAVRDHLQANAAREDVPNAEIAALPAVAALGALADLTAQGTREELLARVRAML